VSTLHTASPPRSTLGWSCVPSSHPLPWGGHNPEFRLWSCPSSAHAPPTPLSKKTCGALTNARSARRATSSSPSPLVRQGLGAGTATHDARRGQGSTYFLGQPWLRPRGPKDAYGAAQQRRCPVKYKPPPPPPSCHMPWRAAVAARRLCYLRALAALCCAFHGHCVPCGRGWGGGGWVLPAVQCTERAVPLSCTASCAAVLHAVINKRIESRLGFETP
jgi:hypothetical protein